MTEATPRKRRRRGWKFKLLVFLVLAGSIGGFSWLALKKKEPPETFAILEAGRTNLVDKLADTGTIELVRTVEVKSTIAGEIRQLPIEAGGQVHAGQLLAVIEPDPNQSLQLYQKRSAVERGQLTLAEQERGLQRQKALFDRRMLPASEYEDAQLRVTRARNELRLARLELEILETKANLAPSTGPADRQLDEIRVLAPIDGIVIRRGVEIGEVVSSGLSGLSGGTVMFEIGDPSQMIVRADIAEIDIAKLRVDQEVAIVVDAYPDTTYRGRVRWIAPVGIKQPGSPIVTFDTEIDVVDHEPRLRQGMSCDIDVIFSRRDSVLFLPVEAIIERFDDDEEGAEPVKGKRGEFVTYVVRPDSAAVDSAAADTTAAVDGDSTGAATAMATTEAASAPAGSTAVVVAEAEASAAGAADSAVTDSTVADSAVTDSSAAAKGPKKPETYPLERFEEVTLQIGLETSTKVEILGGVEAGDRVAADPQLIARKLEEKKTADAASAAKAED